jgi:hypothetical protein
MKSPSTLRFTTLVLAAIVPLLFAACASTTVENEGAAQGVTKLRFKKLVVFAPFNDPEKRRAAENELKARITRAECIPSYTILPDRKDLKDLDQVRAAIHATGADGIVVMRPTYYMTESKVSEGKIHEVTEVSATSFGGYYGGYYGPMAGDYEVRQFAYQDPETVKNTKILEIETTLYDAATEKRLWSGRVISKNPLNVKQLISDAVDAIRATMVRDDLIPAPGK